MEYEYSQDDEHKIIDALPDNEVNIAKCVSCGANIKFDPSSQLLKCDYCNNVVDFSKSYATENISIENLNSNHSTWEKETQVFKCDNCGALEVVSKTEIAKACSYCHSTSVVASSSISGVKPDSVLPFRLDSKAANEFAEKWVKGKFFVTKKFKKSFSPDALRGVYNPAFVFDSNTFSTYQGSLGKHYTVTVGSGKNRHTVTKTRWFRVSGTHYERYDNITINASDMVAEKSMQKISPFSVELAQTYSENYLHGFSANHYSKDGLKCWSQAQNIIYKETEKRLKRGLHSKYNFDVIGSDFRTNTQCYNIGYNYVLLPLYIGHCRYKNKDYNYYINGYNGQITGKMPISAGKIFSLIGIGILVVAGLGLLGYAKATGKI